MAKVVPTKNEISWKYYGEASVGEGVTRREVFAYGMTHLSTITKLINKLYGENNGD